MHVPVNSQTLSLLYLPETLVHVYTRAGRPALFGKLLMAMA